jgi:hypothetical protein
MIMMEVVFAVLAKKMTISSEQLVLTHIPHPNCHKRIFTENYLETESKKALYVLTYELIDQLKCDISILNYEQ